MANRMLAKIRSNLLLYRKELQEQGISYLITARIIKFPLTRSLYNVFKPESVKIRGLTMYIDKRDMIVSQMLYTNNVWDPYTSSVFAKIVRKGDTVLDIGAHIGYYSLLAAEKVGDSGKIIAFEPDSVSFGLLKKNIDVNSFSMITPIKKAVSDKKGTYRFYINRLNTGDNKLIKDGTSRESVRVETITLDEYLKNTKVDVIKIDIQGAEVRALHGMKTILRDNPMCRILIEFWPRGLENAGSNAKELLTFLTKRSYLFLLVDEESKVIKKITVSELLHTVKKGGIYDTNLLCYKPTDSRFPL